MDKLEYLKKQKELGVEFDRKKFELMKEFVDSNNSYNVGDKVTDHIGSILIDKIRYTFGFTGDPCAVYEGIQLNKDGKQNKRGDRRAVYQSNLI